MAKGSKKAKEKGEALVAKTYQEEQTGLWRLNLTAFEPAMRAKIIGLMKDVQSDVSDIARSHLKIGHTLSEARLLMEQQGERIFVAFINEIPGMSMTTAYRYINAWDHAKNIFPELILQRILAANLPMIGGKDQMFGKYTEAVKKMKLDVELQDAVEKGKISPEFADEWVKKVQLAQSELHYKRSAKTPDPSALQEECFYAVRRRWKRLPENKQTVAWLSNLFGFLLDAAGFASPATVQPRKAPKEWAKEEAKPTTEERKTKEEGEAGKSNGKEASA